MKGLFSSKKFLAAGLAALVAFAATLFGLSQEQIWTILTPLLAFVGAQGLADMGKSKALIETAPIVLVKPDPDELLEPSEK